ncbi:tape measure protein [Corynebacterium flavescens]|uniref:tape measure protein n=3 Tax=Corynebacterium flavescens TaxID=28028 RepID=UPI0026495810|nr:tape measure protein [Corynebacterium flavescens]MDN6199376.1 tape measure protein [Corynebacterium flavescens]
MAELGVGYISIVPEVSKISPTVAKALNGLDPVAEKSGKSAGGKISAGLSTALKGSVASVGVAAGGLVATSIAKGMGRLTGIENAEASLRGLGHEASSVTSIMDNALASVKGTSFGLESAAGVAASAVAAGVKPGADLERTLKMVGDAATIAGTDMSSMGSIVNKVATSDMMQMDVANQLMDAGIPIIQMVAKEMGVTAEEARKLASDGEVSFETFRNALEKGVGGAALEAGNTFKGAMANTGAALGRLGATGLKPFFDLSKQGFSESTKAIDGLNERLKPLASSMSDWLQGSAVPGLAKMRDNLNSTWDAARGSSEVQGLLSQTGIVVRDLVDAGRDLAPVMGKGISAISQASAALGVGTWQLALTGLEGIGAAAKIATPPLEMFTKLMEEHPNIVAAAVAAYAGMKTVPSIIEKLSPAFEKVSSAASASKTNVSVFGGAMAEAYGYARQANPEMGRLGAAFQVVAGKGGVASAAMDKLKGAANGVMGLFGGPWGVALLGAGVAINSVVQANQRAESAQEAMAAAARDSAAAQSALESAVAGTTGALNEQGLAAAARIAKNELSQMTEMASQAGDYISVIKAPDLSWWEQGHWSSAWREYAGQVEDAKAQMDAIESAARKVGIPMSELNNVIAEGGADYMALVGHLRSVGGASDTAANQIEGTRAKLDQMIRDARALDPAVAQAASAIDVLADSSGKANDKLGALESLMQAMGLAPKDAEAAMMDAAAAVDEIVEAAENAQRPFEQMGDALFDIDGKLDPANEGARDLSGSLNDLRGKLQDVAVNGGDVQGAFDGMQPALQALQEEFGLTDEQLQGLVQSYGLLPREMQIGVALEGASEATKDLGEVWAALEQLPPGESIEMSVQDEDAIAALEAVGVKVEEIPGSDNVLISAETEEAQDKIGDLILRMADLGEVKVSPEVLLNTDPLVGSAAEAESILDALNIKEPTPQAKIIIDELLAGKDIAQGELDFLASQSPTPKADLNKELLDSNVKISHEMLDALQARPTKPILDANGQPLFASVNQSKNKLAELRDKTVTIRIQEWREYYSSGRAQSTSGTAVGQHYGATGGRFDPMAGFAHLPAYALGARHSGYRLPSSGPGTNLTDGFLAVNHAGTPVAHLDKDEWVVNGRSSEKYNRVIGLINRDDPAVQHLAKYADGGRAGRSADEVLRFARGERVGGHQAGRALEGAPYVWGGVNWGDCSGAMSALARFAVGLAPFAARFATGNQREALASMGFSPGLGGPGDLSIGWFNGGAWGGHTSGTVRGTNMEMGGGRGNGQIGGGAAGASHPQYTDHAHISLGGGGGDDDGPIKVDPGLQWQASEYTTPGSTGYYIPSAASGSLSGTTKSTKSNAPKSWSEIAGNTAQTAVSGQVSDALGVLGLSDSPGFLNAYGEWVDAATVETQNTIQKVDEEKLATLEENLKDAEDDLKLKKLKVKELKSDASESSRESARIAVEKAERKLDDINKDIDETKKGKTYEVNEDGTLGSEVKDPVVATGPKRAPTVAGLSGALQDALLAVVGNRPTPATLPLAVKEMLAALPAFRDGGWVGAPGGPRDDRGLVRVSNREFIVNAGAAARNRGLLEHVNAGGDVAPQERGGDTWNIQGSDSGEIIRRIKAEMMVKTMQMMGG